jgi:hypothetical protein
MTTTTNNNNNDDNNNNNNDKNTNNNNNNNTNILSNNYILFLKSISYDEKEYKQFEQSALSKTNRKDGFEGCINYHSKKNKCQDGGYYLCEYSPEGECTNCEHISHPERFTGCIFCRRPFKYEGGCPKCNGEFQKYMKNIFLENKNDFSDKQIIDQGSFQLYSKNTIEFHLKNTHRKIIPDFSNKYGEWKGFVSEYTNGQYKHIIPTFTKEQINEVKIKESRPLTWDNKDQVLLSYLLLLGIDLYDVVQIKNQ